MDRIDEARHASARARYWKSHSQAALSDIVKVWGMDAAMKKRGVFLNPEDVQGYYLNVSRRKVRRRLEPYNHAFALRRAVARSDHFLFESQQVLDAGFYSRRPKFYFHCYPIAISSGDYRAHLKVGGIAVVMH